MLATTETTARKKKEGPKFCVPEELFLTPSTCALQFIQTTSNAILIDTSKSFFVF